MLNKLVRNICFQRASLEIKNKAFSKKQLIKEQENVSKNQLIMESQIMDGQSSSCKKKRARIGGPKTPESGRIVKRPTPNKRQRATRLRTLKDVFNIMQEQTDNIELDGGSSTSKTENKSKSEGSDAGPVVKATKTERNLQTGPSSRWGQSMCLMNEREALLIGGQGDRLQFCRDAIWHLNLETGNWKVPETSSDGQKPENRMGHTAVFDPTVRSIYLYGGSKNKKWYSDVHFLDTDEWKWRLVKTHGKAPTRAYHSCTLYRHELWIFGGVFPQPDPQPDGCSNEIEVFTPMEENWYTPIVMGEKPLARSGHSATLLGDKLVVFGGWDAPICYNDIHVLDLCIVEWSKPEVRGTPPSPRSWHASTRLTGNRLLIHGGYNGNDPLDDSFIFNMDTFSWTRVALEPILCARTGHSALYLPYSETHRHKDRIIIFGGGDNDGRFFKDLLEIMVPFETDNVIS